MSEPRYEVVDGITTPTRRIPAGTTVTAADLDGPLGVEDWQRLGRLREAAADVLALPAPMDGASDDDAQL